MISEKRISVAAIRRPEGDSVGPPQRGTHRHTAYSAWFVLIVGNGKATFFPIESLFTTSEGPCRKHKWRVAKGKGPEAKGEALTYDP